MATTEQIYDQAMKNRVSTAPAFTWADWTKYQTARFDDWSLWMLNASTWQLASWYYNDSVREDVKRQFMEWTYNQATTKSNIPVNQTTTTPLWTSQPKTPNLYAMTQDQLQWQKSQVMQDYYSAVSWFNKQSMADELRLKTWWTVDVDKQIKTERDKLNSLLPELMQKYAHLDPNQRDALIRQEEQWIRNTINNLEAIREYRVWTIQDILTRDIAQEEQKIKWLEMAYKMYNEVLWDKREADKLKRDIEKEALAMEKMRLELDQYKQISPLKQREEQLSLMDKEQKLWVEWSPGSTSYWQTDITDLATKYPNNASIKNNNPGNIKYNPSWFNQVLDKAWIQYTMWTWATDWWNFLKFKSVEDWLVARSLLLKWDSYKNLSVDQAMKRWSNNWYWAEILPGINKNTKIKDLSNEQLANLMQNQIKREDSVMYKELINRWINPAKIITPGEYKKTDTIERIDSKTDFTKLVNDVDSYIKYNKAIPKWITDKLSIKNADNILKSDTDLKLKNDKILDIASDEAYNEYMTRVDIDELSNMKNWDDIINYIKNDVIFPLLEDVKLSEFKKMTNEEIKNSLQESDKEYIKNIINQSWVGIQEKNTIFWKKTLKNSDLIRWLRQLWIY